MIEMTRILCPVDFSDYSRRALDHAFALARWYRASVEVLHVYHAQTLRHPPGVPVLDPVVLATPNLEGLEAELASFVAAAAAPGVSITQRLQHGDPLEAIVDEARRIQADLLVMGTHGRSGLERLLLGSVTEHVLRRASCPVLTVPRRAADAVPATPVLFKRILCAVDFSDCSTRALRYALSLAEEADAELTLLHALGTELEGAPVVVSGGLQHEAQAVLGTHFRGTAEIARDRMLAAVPPDAAVYCRVDAVVESGFPAPEILRVAAERRSELIVLGVHGGGAVGRLVFGSTTQDVMRGAACPVLTVG